MSGPVYYDSHDIEPEPAQPSSQETQYMGDNVVGLCSLCHEVRELQVTYSQCDWGERLCTRWNNRIARESWRGASTLLRDRVLRVNQGIGRCVDQPDVSMETHDMGELCHYASYVLGYPSI